jgi:hypothetical protein
METISIPWGHGWATFKPAALTGARCFMLGTEELGDPGARVLSRLEPCHYNMLSLFVPAGQKRFAERHNLRWETNVHATEGQEALELSRLLEGVESWAPDPLGALGKAISTSDASQLRAALA